MIKNTIKMASTKTNVSQTNVRFNESGSLIIDTRCLSDINLYDTNDGTLKTTISLTNAPTTPIFKIFTTQ